MSFTAAAVKRNRVTAVVIFVLALAGVMSYQSMPRQTDPGFIIRTAQIVTFFPGASPERVEQLVTDKLEAAVQEIPELDFVVSSSKTGLSLVLVQIRASYTKMRPIWDNLRRKVDRIRPTLPAGIVGPTVNDEFGDVYGILFTVASSGDDFSAAELKQAADEIRDELLRIEDVAEVEILGAQAERIFVEYQNARLAQLGLSPMAVRSMLESRNIIMPGGNVTVDNERIILEPSGNFVSVEQLRRTVIHLPGTREVSYLGDIAEVKRGYIDPPQRLVRANGDQALVLAISMREGGNLIDLGTRVKEFYARLPSLYPHGIEFGISYFEPDTVEQKVDSFVASVLQSVAVVLLVMLLTLGLRTGAVVATLIPSTMLISLLVMDTLGIWLEQVSLAALIISLGLLVDNAIVMSESIAVRMNEGESPLEAAVSSAHELQVPLLTSSLTTAAAFLPIYLSESETGEYTAPLFKVVSITLLVSWGLALTMTPALCVYFLRAKQQSEGTFDTPLYRGYRRLLQIILKRRKLALVGVVGVFFGAMQLFALVPSMFFPGREDPFFVADFKLAQATSIERTQQMASEIDAFIRDELAVNEERAEGVTSWTSFVGASPPRFVLTYAPTVSEPNAAVLMVHTTSHEATDGIMERLERFATERFPDVEPYVRRLATGPPVTQPVQVRISGTDASRVYAIVDSVKQRLGQIPGARNVGDDSGTRVKKLLVAINEERARRAGVTNLDIATSLQTYLSGLEVTQYREDDQVIPVVLRSAAGDRQDIAQLESLNVFSQSSGRSVPLRQVAAVKLAFQPSVIQRRDRYRTITVHSELEPGTTVAEVIGQLQPWLDQQRATQWGLGYRYEFGGEVESSERANAAIAAKLPLGGLIIIMLLVWQFNSLRKPVIVLTTIPLALIGVVLGLLAMRSYFGFMTLLGVISLAGIVINNAIVLLERIQLELQEHGLSPQHAIIQAAQRRMRPILLTTATTIASLIPLYLGGGSMFEPMAVAIMFGLLFSTALTLGFVPLLYALMYRVKYPRDFAFSAGAAAPRSSSG